MDVCCVMSVQGQVLHETTAAKIENACGQARSVKKRSARHNGTETSWSKGHSSNSFLRDRAIPGEQNEQSRHQVRTGPISPRTRRTKQINCSSVTKQRRCTSEDLQDKQPEPLDKDKQQADYGPEEAKGSPVEGDAAAISQISWNDGYLSQAPLNCPVWNYRYLCGQD